MFINYTILIFVVTLKKWIVNTHMKYIFHMSCMNNNIVNNINVYLARFKTLQWEKT